MEDPVVGEWFGRVSVEFPGATAERVEALVAEPLESELREVEDVNSVETTAQPEGAILLLELKQTTTDLDQAWERVRERLSQVAPTLPQGVSEPQLDEIDLRVYALIVALTWDSPTPVNYGILNRLSQDLSNQLRSLGAVENIDYWARPQEEIQVQVNPTALASVGLTPQQLSQQIRLSDAKTSAGVLRTARTDLLIEATTELDSLEQVRQIPLQVGPNGNQLLRLGDVAEVNKGIQLPPSELAVVNGQPGIALAVLIEPEQRIDQWSQFAYGKLNEFQQAHPEVGVQILLDQNQYVSQRLSGLLGNLLWGALWVIASTGLLMGLKSALAIGLSLPLSTLMVLGAMQLLGIPLHQISVTGLVVALGMLIDNAIVVVDEMQHQQEQGLSTSQAIAKTVRYLTVPLLASTLTTVLTFLPIALLPGDIGEFLKTIATSVILALLSSLVLSLTLIPALNGWLQRLWGNPKLSATHYRNGSPFYLIWINRGISFGFVTRLYRKLLNLSLSQPLITLMVALIVPITGFMVAGSLEEQFFPPQNGINSILRLS
jgi:multidrug efflux pump subunit AcrB